MWPGLMCARFPRIPRKSRSKVRPASSGFKNHSTRKGRTCYKTSRFFILSCTRLSISFHLPYSRGMVALPRPEVICTHESDLDGLVSGLLLQRLAEKLFGQRPPLEAYHNHNWKQRSLSEKAAWVADMTFETRLDRPNWVII